MIDAEGIHDALNRFDYACPKEKIGPFFREHGIEPSAIANVGILHARVFQENELTVAGVAALFCLGVAFGLHLAEERDAAAA